MASAVARPTLLTRSASAAARLLGLLLGAGQIGLTGVLLHLDRQLALGDRRLLLGARLGLAQLALLLGGELLPLVGADLLVGDLPLAQLGQDLLDLVVALGAGPRRADQHLLQFEVIEVELGLHLLARLALDRAAVLQQLDQGAGLADVLEIGADHRVQGLLDQLLDVAEPLDDQRRLAVVDVDHDRDRQGRLERVAGDQRHLGQVLVELVRAHGHRLPLQDEVGGRHHGHAAGIGVEGVLARQQRVAPHAALTVGDQLAVAIALAGGVGAAFTGVGHHHAHLADLDHGLVDPLDGREQPVDVVGAFDQDLQLTTLAAAGGQELAGLLEAVVIGRVVLGIDPDQRRDQFARRQAWAVMDGDHSDLVVGVLDHHRLEAAAFLDDLGHLLQQVGLAALQAEREGAVLGHDHELGQVDGVGALAQDLALRPLLAAVGQEFAGVLEVDAVRMGGQGLVGLQRRAVTGEHVADPPLRDRHQALDVQPVLEREEKVQAAAQDVGLKAGLLLQRDQAAGDRTAPAPQLLDHRDAVVADVANHARARHEHGGEHDEKR
jgi:hypothetical protein